MADMATGAAGGAATGAMFGPWGALAGALLGLGKGALDKKAEDKDRAIQAETTRYSPWTHMQAQAPKRADFLGSAMQGGMTGAAMGQNMNQQDQQNALLNAQQSYWEKMLQQQPTAGMGPSGANYQTGVGLYPGAGAGMRPAYTPPGGY